MSSRFPRRLKPHTKQAFAAGLKSRPFKTRSSSELAYWMVRAMDAAGVAVEIPLALVSEMV